jgi:hypothetical protein
METIRLSIPTRQIHSISILSLIEALSQSDLPKDSSLFIVAAAQSNSEFKAGFGFVAHWSQTIRTASDFGITLDEVNYLESLIVSSIESLGFVRFNY